MKNVLRIFSSVLENLKRVFSSVDKDALKSIAEVKHSGVKYFFALHALY